MNSYCCCSNLYQAELLKELEFDDPFNYREGHDLDAASRRSGSLYPLKIQGQRKWHLEGRARTCYSTKEAYSLLKWKTSLDQSQNQSIVRTLDPGNSTKTSPCAGFGTYYNHVGSQ